MPRSLVVALGLMLPLASLAQSVRGTVVTTGAEPVSGVVVQLVDSASEVAVRALTNERGEFRLTAVPGTYRLRTLRIGFRPVTSPPFVLQAREDRLHDLTLTGLPVRLGTVQIVGRNPCSTLADSAAGVHLVWEQVRTALTAAQLSAGSRAMTATIIGFDRTLDPDARRIREQSTSVRQAFVAQPW